MSKTIQEQIAVMRHFANGGEIEICKDGEWSDITNSDFKGWNFAKYDFRIKEQKKTVTIEKWLMKDGDKESLFVIVGDKSYFENYYISNEKVKLLETYEVEL